MLKKLYKHEFYSLFRTLFPIYGALLGFALLSRLSYLDEAKNTTMKIVSGFTTTFYVFSIIAMFIVGIVIIVMRFYKNLLSHEGYLTFTLPFTATQHIICKLICGVVVTIVNFLIMICSLLILGAGTEVLDKILESIPEVFNMANKVYSKGQIAIFIVELVVMIILSMFQSLLMFYAAMAIGQQFKNKVGGAVISYICLYAAVQIISTIVLIPTVFVNAEKISNYVNSGITAIEVFLAIPIILAVLLAAAYFFITRYFLSKKLNLE